MPEGKPSPPPACLQHGSRQCQASDRPLLAAGSGTSISALHISRAKITSELLPNLKGQGWEGGITMDADLECRAGQPGCILISDPIRSPASRTGDRAHPRTEGALWCSEAGRATRLVPTSLPRRHAQHLPGNPARYPASHQGTQQPPTTLAQHLPSTFPGHTALCQPLPRSSPQLQCPAAPAQCQLSGDGARYLVALDVPVLALGGWWLPGDIQLGGSGCLHGHVLRCSGGHCAEGRSSITAQLQPRWGGKPPSMCNGPLGL